MLLYFLNCYHYNETHNQDRHKPYIDGPFLPRVKGMHDLLCEAEQQLLDDLLVFFTFVLDLIIEFVFDQVEEFVQVESK
jgi:hypothetical protein